MSEYKNNFIVETKSYEKQMAETQKDKEGRFRNTTYSQFKATSQSFFNRPGSGRQPRVNQTAPLSDGNILSDLENLGEGELRERLIVAETIMKKLYTKNKDLEMGLSRAQTMIKTAKTQ